MLGVDVNQPRVKGNTTGISGRSCATEHRRLAGGGIGHRGRYFYYIYWEYEQKIIKNIFGLNPLTTDHAGRFPSGWGWFCSFHKKKRNRAIKFRLFGLCRPYPGAMPMRCASMRAAGHFSPFIFSPFIKFWIRIFCVRPAKKNAFGMALLVAASPPVRKRRGEAIRVAFRSPRRHVGDVRVGIAVDGNFFVFFW
jgi:hypothetical protein